jgi:predicted DNA-binding transcriptional regulator AlpA
MSNQPTESSSELHQSVEGSVKTLERRLPITERYGVTVQMAAEYSGISRSRIYELLAAGELEGKIIHGRRIVVVQSLLRMCGAAPSAKRKICAA